MEKESNIDLRQIQTNALLGNLDKSVYKLTKSIEENNIQNSKLEYSNFKLQKVMTILTGVGITIAFYNVMESYLKNFISPIFAGLISVILAVILYFIIIHLLEKDLLAEK